jgi:hypothetical protein
MIGNSSLERFKCNVFCCPFINKKKIINVLSELTSRNSVVINSTQIIMDFFSIEQKPDVLILAFSLRDKNSLFGLVPVCFDAFCLISQIAEELSKTHTVPIIMLGMESDVWHNEGDLESFWEKYIIQPGSDFELQESESNSSLPFLLLLLFCADFFFSVSFLWFSY